MTTTSNGPSRRTLVKGAAWSVPVVAVGAAAPAMASSLRMDPGINGWVLNSPRSRFLVPCGWTLRVDSAPSDPPATPDGAPFGLYLYNIEPDDIITNATITYWIIGEQSSGATWSQNSGHSACWGTPVKGASAIKADGLRYTPYTWTYSCSIPAVPAADGRVWLGHFDSTATFTQPSDRCDNVTYWTQRSIVVNGEVLTFERRNGTLGTFQTGNATPQSELDAAESTEPQVAVS